MKRIFVLGDSPEWNEMLKDEHKSYKDILQINFVDAYRNMTYKHLSGYWWMTQNCENAQYILRTDDDQAVDTLHLPKFLNHYIGDSKTENERFYLCYALNQTEPKRDPDNKWYVSHQDYPAEYYPEYCCGWAYVTNIPTIKSILDVSKNEPYFWIDDMFVTGILASKVPDKIKIYNWKNSFLSDHSQHTNEIIHGDLFSPELMVASDITSEDIKKIWRKFVNCHEKTCYDQIYENPDHKEILKPIMHIKENKTAKREEL